MKTSPHQLRKILGTIAISGFLTSPLGFAADERERPFQSPPAPPHDREAAKDTPDSKGKPDPKRVERVKGQIAELHKAGKHDEARQLEQRLRAAVGGDSKDRVQHERGRDERQPRPDAAGREHNPIREPGKPPQGGPPPQVRLQHLREAVNHLNAAGFERLAMAARGEIERIEVEARRHEEARRREAEARTEAGVAPRGAGPDSGGDLRAEMTRLRREMEELRKLVKHLKENAEAKHEPRPVPQRKSED